MFALTLQQVLKLFLFLLTGFVFRKLKFLPEETPAVLSKVEFYLLVPSSLIFTFSNHFTVATLSSYVRLLLIALVTLFFSIAVGIFWGRRLSKDPYEQNLSIYSIIVPNISYIGTPLILSLFGSEILMLVLLFNIPFAIYGTSEGMRLLLDRSGKLSAKSFISPPFVSMLIGILIGILNMSIPPLVNEILNDFSSCIGPIALVLTGCLLSDFDIRTLLGNPLIYKIVFLRMIVIPACVLFFAKFVGISKDIVLVMTAFITMPTGLNTVIVPASFGRDVHLGAGAALVSSKLAIITIPLFFQFFM